MQKGNKWERRTGKDTKVKSKHPKINKIYTNNTEKKTQTNMQEQKISLCVGDVWNKRKKRIENEGV